MTEHRVKSWPHLFSAALAGVKTHELRRATDRNYQVGDLLRLQEFDPETNQYSGREHLLEITYVTSAEFPCALSDSALARDHCILSVRSAVAQAELGQVMRKWTFTGLAIDFLTIFAVFTLTLALIT